MHRSTTKRIAIVAGMIFLPVSGAAAQENQPHSLGAFIGVTDRDDVDMTIGAEYEYRLDRYWSAGGILEHTPDAFGDNSATLVMGTVNMRPGSQLKLTGGVGVEFNEFDDDIRFRIGAGYDVIQGPFNVTPRIAIDFGDGDENIILGATLSRSF